MFEPDKYNTIDGVYYLTPPDTTDFNEEIYVAARRKEGRLYSDEIVKLLPNVKDSDPLKKEWDIRKSSSTALCRYLHFQKPSIILEIGCGNGWLSNSLSEKTGSFVVGLDINQTELKQAARVFKENKKLMFAYGNISKDIFPKGVFDIIIFSSSLQYFKYISETLQNVFIYLKEDGEIHILDTFFYTDKEAQFAKKRTNLYYEELGFDKMSGYYHHHTWSELKEYEYTVLNSRYFKYKKFVRLLGIRLFTGFPWIMIKKNKHLNL